MYRQINAIDTDKPNSADYLFTENSELKLYRPSNNDIPTTSSEDKFFEIIEPDAVNYSTDEPLLNLIKAETDLIKNSIKYVTDRNNQNQETSTISVNLLNIYFSDETESAGDVNE